MAKLLRKVSLNKWRCTDDIDKIEFIDYPSASITNDIRISENSLSVWLIEDDTMVDDIVLALITTLQKPDKMEIISFEEEDLLAAGFKFDKTIGNTPVDDVNSYHRNINDLNTVKDACKLANFIYRSVKSENYHIFSKKEVEKIVEDGLNNGRIDISKLNKDFKKYLEEKKMIS